jgi:hypothetical protein
LEFNTSLLVVEKWNAKIFAVFESFVYRCKLTLFELDRLCGIPQVRYHTKLRAEEFGGTDAVCGKARHCQRVVAGALPWRQALRSG